MVFQSFLGEPARQRPIARGALRRAGATIERKPEAAGMPARRNTISRGGKRWRAAYPV